MSLPIFRLRNSRLQKLASSLRRHFENTSRQFCWEPFHVPANYWHLRTPGELFFPRPIWRQFLRTLGEIGRDQFGCAEVSPPWLSLYLDGHFQNWHADVPHGPWAFVFSLTPPKRPFSGGNTLILKPNVLDYWGSLQTGSQDRHFAAMAETIAPDWGQLLIFDPKIPHAVEMVRGALTPQQGRLVLHGWLTEPRPFAEGPLRPFLNAVSPTVEEWLASCTEIQSWHGTWCLRLKANRGRVTSVQTVCNNVVDAAKREYLSVNSQPCRDLMRRLQKISVPASGRIVTLPLNFS